MAALLVAGCGGTVAGNGTYADGATPGPTITLTADPSATDDATGTPTETGSNGDAGEQQTVARAGERWYVALGNRQYEQVCALMTASAQRQASEHGKDCAESARAENFPADVLASARLVHVRAEKVTVDGDRATIPADGFSFVGPGASTLEGNRMKLEREGGDWKVDDIT